MVDKSGAVIGLVTGKQVLLANQQPSEGTAFVIPSPELATRQTDWRSEEPQQGPCGTPQFEEEPLIKASYDSDDPDAADITQGLALQGESINRGEYAAAYELFTPAMQRRQGSVEQWSKGLQTSMWVSVRVTDIERDGRRAVARVEFRTTQDAGLGHDDQTCSDWSQRRTLVPVDGAWRIDRVDNVEGSPVPC